MEIDSAIQGYHYLEFRTKQKESQETHCNIFVSKEWAKCTDVSSSLIKLLEEEHFN